MSQILVVDDEVGIRELLSEILRASGADYVVRLGPPRPALGFLPVPGQGPTLVWKGVRDQVAPDPRQWSLTLGDIELF